MQHKTIAYVFHSLRYFLTLESDGRLALSLGSDERNKLNVVLQPQSCRLFRQKRNLWFKTITFVLGLKSLRS